MRAVPPLRDAAVAAVPLALIPALGAAQGGYLPDAWVWAGALLGWAAALALVLGPGGRLRDGWPWAAAALALLAWTAASTLWSVHPSQSLLEARRTVVYAAAVLALLALARRTPTRVLALATHAAISVLLVYALARYLLEPRRYAEFEGYLLAEPLGYANAVGVLAAMGMLLGAGIAAQAGSRRLRALATGSVPLLALALALAESRGSWLALAIGGGVLLLLEPAPGRLLRTAAAAAPATALLVWLAQRSRLTDLGASPQRSTALVLAAVAVVCAVGTGAAAAASLTASGAKRQAPRRLVLALLVCVALAGALAVGRAGTTQPRVSYWRVAWHDEYLRHPALGSGGGTFGRFWARAGQEATRGGALDAHSLYLETLAELGPAGLVLLGGLLLVPLRGVRRRAAPTLPAAAGAYAAFLVHAGLDWDWELPAVVLAGLCCGAAVLLGDGDDPPPVPARLRAAAAVVALALGALSIAGVRSDTVPSASGRAKAPTSGAFAMPFSPSG